MSYPVYTVYSGDVLPIFFDSFDGGTGASITMTGLAVTDIEIYKDGSATQRASDAGYTLLDTDGIDFDGITGIHGFSIDTGDNTDAGFYAVGSWYHVVVSSITIDGQTVNFVAAAFRIMAAEAVAGVPVVDIKAISGDATAADNLEDFYEETTAIGNLIDMFDGTGYAGGTIKLASDATLNATQGSYAPAKAGDSMALTAAAVDTIWDEVASGHSTAGSFGKYLDSDISANTDHITADYTATEKAAIDLLDDADGGIADIHADVATVTGYLDTEIAAILADTNELQTDLVNGGRLDLILDGIESHVHTIDGHITADYTATEKAAIDLLDDASGGLADIHSDIVTITGYLDTEIAAILADTNELQTDWTNGGRLDLLLDAIPTATANADALLKRDWTSVTGEAARSCLNAFRILRNARSVSGSTLSVKKEDDVTNAWTADITSSADAETITGIDPS